jgi:hypothetical protein
MRGEGGRGGTRLADKKGGVAQVREELAVQRAVLAGAVHEHKHKVAAHAVQRGPAPEHAMSRPCHGMHACRAT